jgi:hypothetical protein
MRLGGWIIDYSIPGHEACRTEVDSRYASSGNTIPPPSSDVSIEWSINSDNFPAMRSRFAPENDVPAGSEDGDEDDSEQSTSMDDESVMENIESDEGNEALADS